MHKNDQMHITLVITEREKDKPIYNTKAVSHFYNKNLKYRYVTVKIHSTISKLKEVRLKIGLKSVQVRNIAKLRW